MKKVTIALAALALAVAAMPVMAYGSQIGGTPEATVEVNILVSPYAEISNLPSSVDLVVENNQRAETTILFDVLANFAYHVNADIENAGDALLQNSGAPALQSGASGAAGVTSGWEYKVFIDPDDSDTQGREYLLASDYQSTVTFTIVADSNPSGGGNPGGGPPFTPPGHN